MPVYFIRRSGIPTMVEAVVFASEAALKSALDALPVEAPTLIDDLGVVHEGLDLGLGWHENAQEMLSRGERDRWRLLQVEATKILGFAANALGVGVRGATAAVLGLILLESILLLDALLFGAFLKAKQRGGP